LLLIQVKQKVDPAVNWLGFAGNRDLCFRH